MLLSHAKICINPPLGVELSGYGYFLNRRNAGVADDLYARALCLRQEGAAYLILCGDLLGLHPGIVERAKRRISGLTDIPVRAILLVCTHTHTAPACMLSLGCGEVDGGYLETLEDRLVEIGAAAARGPGSRVAGVQWVRQPVEPIGYNRTIPGGPVDSNLYALVFRLEGARSYALVNYACHPVTWGPSRLVSADYPGALLSLLDSRGYDGMFVNGFFGDIDPISNRTAWGSGTQDVVNGYGRILADGLERGLAGAPAFDPSLLYTDFTMDLHLTCYAKEELDACVAQSGIRYPENPEMGKVVRQWAQIVERERPADGSPCTEPLHVQALRIGPVVIAALQGEIYTQVALDIRRLTGDTRLMLLGNANAATRYVATDEDIERGTYGGFSSCYVDGRLPLTTGNATRIAEAVARCVAGLSAGEAPARAV